MELVDMTIKDYINEVARLSPAPGGGTASALMGAQGVALISMVAELTASKEKYMQYKENCEKIVNNCKGLIQKLEKQIDLDTDAYNMLASAFKMKKDTDEEKKVRAEAIHKATDIATEVPLNTMKLCLEGIMQAKELVKGFNTNCASDVGVAILNLNGGLEGAYLNVCINLQDKENNRDDKRIFEEATGIKCEAQTITEEIDIIGKYFN